MSVWIVVGTPINRDDFELAWIYGVYTSHRHAGEALADAKQHFSDGYVWGIINHEVREG